MNEKGHSFKRKKGNIAKPDLNTGRGTDAIKVVGIVKGDGNIIAEVMTNLKYPELKKIVGTYVQED